MAPKYWMITDRNVLRNSQGIALNLGPDYNTDKESLTYWESDGNGSIGDINSWKIVSEQIFQDDLQQAVNVFAQNKNPTKIEDQPHITLFVHGYNEKWDDAAKLYKNICDSLYSESNSLGTCVLFTWPSEGMLIDYLPDRKHAKNAAPDLADVFSDLYDSLTKNQAIAVNDPTKVCRTRTSVIVHSMGNWVLQNAMQSAWTRKNQPLQMSLINQLIMVAADVDNDLFKSGENVDKSDGDAIANLTYRVTALYTRRDDVLLASAGLKHFGKRRLGRSGLDNNYVPPDNICDIDCSKLISENPISVHSAYFDIGSQTYDLMRDILIGIDRNIITMKYLKSTTQDTEDNTPVF